MSAAGEVRSPAAALADVSRLDHNGVTAGDTPIGNTGYLRTERYGVGPIRGTLRVGIDQVREVLGRVVGVVVDREYGDRWYSRTARVGEHGSLLAWAPRHGAGAGQARELEVLVDVSQTACEQLGQHGVRSLTAELYGLGFRPTRVDVHYDDAAYTVTPGQVRDAWLAGQVVSPLARESYNFHESGDGGATLYLGQRTSGTMLRVYNADPLHGEGTGVRWELESKGQLADQVLRTVVMGACEDVPDTFWSWVRRAADFVDRREGAAHGERCEPLAWWSLLIGLAQVARPKLAQVVSTLETVTAWVERSVLPALVKLHAVRTGDPLVRRGNLRWLQLLMRYRAERMRPSDWLQVPREYWPGWERARGWGPQVASAHP